MDSKEHKPKREPRAPKHVIYLNTSLACSRCPVEWFVVDLNPELKAVKCPRCGEYNDIKEAIRRAA
jgi:transcription elongation factor Elf1